jgi:hypothetical protein
MLEELDDANPSAVSGDHLVCHCFGYTKDDIEMDYVEHGRSTVIERIKLEKEAGGCQCALKNPRGR